MRKIAFTILFTVFLMNGVTVLGGTNMVNKEIKSHKIYVIRKVTPDNMIELSNGSRINLLGVDSANNPHVADLLNKVKGKKVIVEEDDLDSSQSGYYIYLWGASHDGLLSFLNKASFEYKGFLDADDKGNIKKGLALFLNATIIKSGLAKTAVDQQFSLKDQFLKWEKEVVKK